MTTAFQASAFQNNSFQIEEGVAAASGGFVGGGTYRYFTPERPPLKGKIKRRIDRAVEQEAKLKAQLLEYETSGVDIDVLNDIAKRITELQLIILRLALESQLAEEYIIWKRKEEEEDIKFIMSIL